MGQARQRGTFETRKAEGVVRLEREAQERAERLEREAEQREAARQAMLDAMTPAQRRAYRQKQLRLASMLGLAGAAMGRA
jgi:hypothetical protein